MKICPKCGKEYGDTNTLCPNDGTVLQKDGDALIGQVLADKYRVDELIDQGGMGAVYRSTHILMDKTVAIKVLHPSLAADDKIVARFSREARAASRISHPHALNVTDFGESENGVVFLVMEYLRGHTLKDVIKREGPLALSRVVEIIRQVCGALDAAHAEGVVHRDLKSDNIMLVEMGSDGDWAKVLDFGIAKIQEPVGQDPALTAPNLIIGTPQYMSPEQCGQASEIDARSDIYSLGVILFEMLAGHVPFTGESPTAIMMQHIQEPPPSIMEERSDLPATVGRVVARSLAKRPEDRFQSAGELAENLALAAEGKSPAEATAAAAIAAGDPDRATNRIVVTTASNDAPPQTAETDFDEQTVVRSRNNEPEIAVLAETVRAETAPPEGFNPWRIIIPAAAALLVAFVVVYALTRNSGPADANANQPLVSDPQAQPVQPSQSPTGQGEQGITSSLPATSPGSDAGANPNANGSPAAGQNPNAGGSPQAVDGNTNNSGDAGQDENTNDASRGQPGSSPDNQQTPDANRNQQTPGQDNPPQGQPSTAPTVPPPVK
ncbi:MAG TPA: protein kinase, partial [Pyrinomonadaceae bacterium]